MTSIIYSLNISFLTKNHCLYFTTIDLPGLNKRKVKYLVVGGIAVNFYGIERATADIDLVVDSEESNLQKFIKAIKELSFKPKIPVSLEEFTKKEKRERGGHKFMGFLSLLGNHEFKVIEHCFCRFW